MSAEFKLSDHLPQDVVAFLQRTWQAPPADDGTELYGFVFNGQVFMARHPPRPMFLEQRSVAEHPGLTVVVGEAGGMTLTTGGMKAEPEEITRERQRCVGLVRQVREDPGLSWLVRQLLERIEDAINWGSEPDPKVDAGANPGAAGRA